MNDSGLVIVLADGPLRRLAPLERAVRDRSIDVRSASTATAAIALVRDAGASAIVTAQTLPDCEGVAMLARARRAAPNAVRVFVPEGGAPEQVLRAVGTADHVMARPSDANELLGAIERAGALSRALDNTRLRRLEKLPGGLPALPPLYDDLVASLQGPDATLERVGAVLARDPASSEQVLGLVNSAWFGLMERVTSVSMAINYLGVTSVASLVLSGFLFREASKRTLAQLGLSKLWDRSLLSAAYAREIARSEALTSRETDDAFTASLLHGAGKVLLAARAAEDYGQLLGRARDQGLAASSAESTLLGFSSAQAGAFLLTNWGLPNSVSEAVCFQECPGEIAHASLIPLTVTHVATALGKAGAPHNWSPRTVAIDEAYLASIGLEERLESWKNACRATARRDEVGV